jgi:alkylation response protein AidB-like acyl-CoA dehydrogenase
VIDFEPTEEQRLMRDAVAGFAKASLRERIRAVETARALPDEVLEAAHEMMLGGVALPEAVGGQGLGWLTAVLLEEEVARVDAAAAFVLPGPAAFGDALMVLGSEAQQTQWLAPFFESGAARRRGAVAWSEAKPNRDRAGLSTTARPAGDGWVLAGRKDYVVNALSADRFVVIAQLDEARGWDGLAAFVVPGDAAGLTRGERYTTLGLDAVEVGAIELVDVKVPAAARLDAAESFSTALIHFFARRSLVVAARAVGLAQDAFDQAREYCDTRTAFGKPIGHFQAVAFNLADRLMDVESARWLVWRAAWSWDSKGPVRETLRDTAHAAAHAIEVAMRAADDCVSLHGGAGFIRDFLAEKLMRDAKQLALFSATPAQLDQLAAAAELGSELDPALLLPTPETQAIFI